MTIRTLLSALVCSAFLAAAAFAADPSDKAPDKKEKEKPKPVNATCPVSDEKVDPEVTANYKGKTVGFCCSDCVKDFNKDPAKYMKKVEAEEAKNKKKDDKKGAQPSADSTKPVNRFCAIEKENAVDPTVKTTTYKGKVVGFCCEDCIKKFDANPDLYMASLK